MPQPFLEGYTTLPCLMVNLILSSNKQCKVLDFAGGTGFIYYRIAPYLLNTKYVHWHIVDNKILTDIGEKYKKDDDNLSYNNELIEKNIKYDIIYINTALQYIYDYKNLLRKLLSYEPSYIVLTRLMSGNIEDYVTCQNIHGLKTPCHFINFLDLISFLNDNNYDLIYKAPCNEESLEGRYEKDIPEELQIPFTINLIFMKES